MTGSAETWRYCGCGEQDGAVAMALDETLLDTFRPGDRPILHLWRWSPPAISLGYGQAWSMLDHAAVDAAGLEVVRRPTGGLAVLHGEDISYGCVVPREYRDWERGMRPPYEFVAAAVGRALRSAGIPCASPPQVEGDCVPGPVLVCSDEIQPYELVSAGSKVLGSAQRRTRHGILVQGTIAPAGPAPIHPFLSGVEGEPVLSRRADGIVLEPGAVARAFGEEHGLVMESWAPADWSGVDDLAERRYRNREWTVRL